jgi:hypothetical protein
MNEIDLIIIDGRKIDYLSLSLFFESIYIFA